MVGAFHLFVSMFGEESGSESVLKGVGLGVKLISVQHETVDVVGWFDAEVQLQVARDICVDLDNALPSLPVMEDSNRTSGAVQLQVLSLGNLRDVDVEVDFGGYGEGGDDIVDRYVGRQKESVSGSRSRQSGCGENGLQLHLGG